MNQEELREEYGMYYSDVYRLCFLLTGSTVTAAQGVCRVFEKRMLDARRFSASEKALVWFCVTAMKWGRGRRILSAVGSVNPLPEALLMLNEEEKLLLFLKDEKNLSMEWISRGMGKPELVLRRQLRQVRRKIGIGRWELTALLEPIRPSSDVQKQMLYSLLEKLPAYQQQLQQRRHRAFVLFGTVVVTGILMFTVFLLSREEKREPGYYDSQLNQGYADVLSLYRSGAQERWTAAEYLNKGLSPLCVLPADTGEYGFLLADLNGDSSAELLLMVGDQLGAIYTLSGDAPICILTARQDITRNLCENLAVKETRKQGTDKIQYTWLRLSGSAFAVEQQLTYHVDEDAPSPWQIGFSHTYASREQAENLLASYPPAKLTVQKLLL